MRTLNLTKQALKPTLEPPLQILNWHFQSIYKQFMIKTEKNSVSNIKESNVLFSISKVATPPNKTP
jgi:hypothetical protein